LSNLIGQGTPFFSVNLLGPFAANLFSAYYAVNPNLSFVLYF